jgi:hypothetical protein
MLDDISLYWFTGTATSGARLYWENNANNFNAVEISLPAAITVFPGEIYRAPRGWAQHCYHGLMYFHEVDKSGHFAAWEEPAVRRRDTRGVPVTALAGVEIVAQEATKSVAIGFRAAHPPAAHPLTAAATGFFAPPCQLGTDQGFGRRRAPGSNSRDCRAAAGPGQCRTHTLRGPCLRRLTTLRTMA